MGQIYFIWGLIGETLSLGVQFGFNWEDWNFKRLNFIFTKLIDWNQGKIVTCCVFGIFSFSFFQCALFPELQV
jgi:hypothetical protein